MKVYLCEAVHPAAYEYLAENAEIVSEESRVYEVDAILNRNLQIDREWMEKSPNLKVIGIHGTGSDGVDLEAARALGITVFNVPYQNADSVAELIIAMAMAMARKLPLADRLIQAGEPLATAPAILQGFEISEKTFGMIGCGDIAMRAARRLEKGFDMKLAGYSPSLTPEKAESLGIIYCASPEEVFEKSDIINLGMHLNENTRGMIDYEMMSHAKKGAVLINTARGAVLREEDLYRALTDGTLAAAACDVFVQEPPVRENPLVTLPNFLALPHIGATTEEALYRVGVACARQIIAALNGETPEYKL